MSAVEKHTFMKLIYRTFDFSLYSQQVYNHFTLQTRRANNHRQYCTIVDNHLHIANMLLL
jgi:hypothetical protein